MDELAAQLGVDPLEVRERNWIKHEEFPFPTVSGLTYDSGNYEAATAKAKELFGYDDLRAEQAEAARVRRPGPARHRRLDVHRDVRAGAVALARLDGVRRRRLGARVDPDAADRQGRSDHRDESARPGARDGVEPDWSPTGWVSPSRTSKYCTVTHRSPARGLDTYGSRSLAVGGMAVLAAADKVIEKAKPIAAQLLEANADDLDFSGGRFGVRGTESGMTLGELRVRGVPGTQARRRCGAVASTRTRRWNRTTSRSRTELTCVRSRSTPRPAATKIRSYVCVDDVGIVVNPVIVEGQVHGGVAQGIAQALFEEAVYDDAGTLITGSFDQYLIPSPPDLPPFVTARTETPATTNQLGVKGVGEAGTIASTPAVVNAVIDAVRHLGVADVQMPCTPYRVWKALQGGSQS